MSLNTISFIKQFISIATLIFNQNNQQLVSGSVPLIIDADFGGPIDDTFAIAYALKEQEVYNTFDIRLLNMAGRNTTARAILLADYLQRSGYENTVDIGIGIPTECGDFFSIGCVGPCWLYVTDNFTLDDYNGIVYKNGISRMIEIIETEGTLTNPIYIITLGTMTNMQYIFETLNRTDLKPYIRLFTMSGSLFSNTEPFGYFIEFNIQDDINAAQSIYNNFDITGEDYNFFSNDICAVTWDTGYYFQIEGDEYKMLLNAGYTNGDLLISELLDMYSIWYKNGGYEFDQGRIFHPNNSSASMYDLEIVMAAAFVSRIDTDEIMKSCLNISVNTGLIFDRFYVFVNDTGHIIDNEEEAVMNGNDTYTPVDFAANFTYPNGVKTVSQFATNVLIATVDNSVISTTQIVFSTPPVSDDSAGFSVGIDRYYLCLLTLCLLLVHLL